MAKHPVLLGHITLPSGAVAIFDVGVTAFVLSGQIPELPLVKVTGLPADRALDVFGVAVADDEYGEGWDHVFIRVADGDVAGSEHVGDVIVDFARIIFIDDVARAAWVHNDAIDGLADFIFWGRDAAALAAVVGAPEVPGQHGTFGWVDRPIDDIISIGKNAEAERAARGLVLATDFRPHSHHYQTLQAVRASEHEAGGIDVGGARALLWMTSRGDGVFPVYADYDVDGALVQVRVQLCVDEGHAEEA